LDTYLDALQYFPDNCETLQVTKGIGNLIKKDIFRNLMWYSLPDSTKQYPLTIERVKKIKSLNEQGVIPNELEAVELTASRPKEVEPEFVDVVGQISLRSLEKTDKKRNQQQRQQRQQKQQQQPQQQQQRQQPHQHGKPPQKGQQQQQQQKKQQPHQRPPQKRK
jgi:hypothetical protein